MNRIRYNQKCEFLMMLTYGLVFVSLIQMNCWVECTKKHQDFLSFIDSETQHTILNPKTCPYQQVHLALHNYNDYFPASSMDSTSPFSRTPRISVTWSTFIPASSVVSPAAQLSNYPFPDSTTSTSTSTNSNNNNNNLENDDINNSINKENPNIKSKINSPISIPAQTHDYYSSLLSLHPNLILTESNITQFLSLHKIHDVLFPELLPSRTYYYRVGDSSLNSWSQTFHFTSPPSQIPLISSSHHLSNSHATHKSSNPKRSYTIATFGDMSTHSTASQFLSSLGSATHISDHHSGKNPTSIPDSDLDLFLHLGDFGYAQTSKYAWNIKDLEYVINKQLTWDLWFRKMQNFTAYHPYMVILGNHETGRFDINSVPYQNRFYMPNYANSVTFESETIEKRGIYYWFEYGPFHFIVLSSEHNTSVGSDQNTWLKQHLKHLNTSLTSSKQEQQQVENDRIVIMAIHRPMYSTSLNDGSVKPLRKNIENLLKPYPGLVDIVLCGHDHSYERSFPVFDDEIVSKPKNHKGVDRFVKGKDWRPVYIRVGTAGIARDDEWQKDKEEWSRKRIGDKLGWLKLEGKDGARAIKVQFISAEEGDDNLVLDQFEIVKLTEEESKKEEQHEQLEKERLAKEKETEREEETEKRKKEKDKEREEQEQQRRKKEKEKQNENENEKEREEEEEETEERKIKEQQSESERLLKQQQQQQQQKQTELEREVEEQLEQGEEEMLLTWKRSGKTHWGWWATLGLVGILLFILIKKRGNTAKAAKRRNGIGSINSSRSVLPF